MNTHKDSHSVTSSPLMHLEFIIIHTIIWGFALCVLFYVFQLLLSILRDLPGINMLRRLLMPLLYCLNMFFEWPNVMLTALVITIIRCVLRRTEVSLSDNTIIIRRPGHTDRLFLADFIRPKTVESYISFHFVGWVFRRRYLIFQNDSGKEVKYRLYEYSEKDLNQVMQLLTRVSRTEQLAEDDKTEIMMNAFQNTSEMTIDPRHLWRQMLRPLGILFLLSAASFGVFLWLFYRMIFIPPQYDTGSVLVTIIGYGSIALSLGSLVLLCRSFWALVVNAVLKRPCPQKIVFAGNMLQIDHTMYSVNRIQQVIMNPPARKLPLFGHYRITLITMDGTHQYWLGNTAGLGHGNWQTLCRKMQGLLVSCPAKLTYR